MNRWLTTFLPVAAMVAAVSVNWVESAPAPALLGPIVDVKKTILDSIVRFVKKQERAL